MTHYESFEYSPCAMVGDGTKFVQVVLHECAEFWGVYGRVKDPVTGHLLAEHIVAVATQKEAESLTDLLNYLNGFAPIA